MTSETHALRLDHYRKPFLGEPSELTIAQRDQLQALIDSDMDSEGMSVDDFFDAATSEEDHPIKALEYIDVLDATTGLVVANLLLYPFGDGAVVHAGTTRMIANIVQHGVAPHKTTTPAWMAAFAAAWREGAKRLGVDDPGHFTVD